MCRCEAEFDAAAAAAAGSSSGLCILHASLDSSVYGDRKTRGKQSREEEDVPQRHRCISMAVCLIDLQTSLMQFNTISVAVQRSIEASVRNVR